MRIRITKIGLRCGDKSFAEGEEVEVGGEDDCLPHDVALARLKAGTAEVVGGEDTREGDRSLDQVVDGYLEQLNIVGDSLLGTVEQVESANPEDRAAAIARLVEGLGAYSERMAGFAPRIQALLEQINTEAGAGEGGVSAPHQPQPASGEGDASPPDGAAADSAASNDSSGMEQGSARVAHNHEVGGSNPSSASNDASAQALGAGPEAAGASAPAPKAPATRRRRG